MAEFVEWYVFLNLHDRMWTSPQFIDINKRDCLFHVSKLKNVSHLMYTLTTLINELSKYFFGPKQSLIKTFLLLVARFYYLSIQKKTQTLELMRVVHVRIE